MAIPKIELAPEPPRKKIVDALADAWERDIDNALTSGYREILKSELTRIRTPVSWEENQAALKVVMGRFSAVGWTVEVDDKRISLC